MILKIISGLLTLVAAFMSLRHGWAGVRGNLNPQEAQMMTSMGITQPMQLIIHGLTLLVGGLLLFPRTFLVGNLLSTMLFMVIIPFALSHGQVKIALTEVPFLLVALLLIWLGHPFSR